MELTRSKLTLSTLLGEPLPSPTLISWPVDALLTMFALISAGLVPGCIFR